MTVSHLHVDDYPETLALLATLLRRKQNDPAGLAEIGYSPTEHGATVDWDLLTRSWLSSTEIGVVHVARGVAILENHGGPSPRLNQPLRDAIAAVTPAHDLPVDWVEP